MDGDRYPLHHRSEVEVDADAQRLFAQLDDHRRLAGHMRNTWETGGEPQLLVATRLRPCARAAFWSDLRGMVHAANGRRRGDGHCWHCGAGS